MKYLLEVYTVNTTTNSSVTDSKLTLLELRSGLLFTPKDGLGPTVNEVPTFSTLAALPSPAPAVMRWLRRNSRGR
jgi:hypothetical protein